MVALIRKSRFLALIAALGLVLGSLAGVTPTPIAAQEEEVGGIEEPGGEEYAGGTGHRHNIDGIDWCHCGTGTCYPCSRTFP